MSVISTQDMEQYRQLVAGINLSVERKDELICIVHSIMSHFVDSAFGVQTDQISLAAGQKSRFQAAFERANIQANPEHETVDPDAGGANHIDSGPKGQIAP
ncbi:hypothetical protein [Sphingomonas hengshuiensis]|uniref:hypothetical protein n=1 Tax=Sphingomonas hengshuiensis TaxID=1609977 RepID=UPI0012B8D018|nr:hypothetical protein [Sphingomonas hengshuiensis]